METTSLSEYFVALFPMTLPVVKACLNHKELHMELTYSNFPQNYKQITLIGMKCYFQ